MTATAAVLSINHKRVDHMGNPQTEDGFVRIANELFDAILRSKFSGRQVKVLMAVIRKTYGFNKKSDEIGLSQLAEITGLARSHVSTTIAELVAANVIYVTDGNNARIISINKNYLSWVLPKQEQGVTKTVTVTDLVTVTKTVTEGVTKTVNEVLPKREPQYTGFKDNKKTSKPLSDCSDDSAKILDHLNQSAGTKYRPVKANISMIEARLKEGATVDDFRRVIDAKVAEWGGDQRMAAYLRPKTLFNATNFNSYVGAISAPAHQAPKTLGGMKVGKSWA